MKKSFVTIFCCSIFLFLPKKVFASDEFDFGYKVSFEAKNNSSVHVEQEITVKNRFSNIYATSYSLIIDKSSPKNIIAYDSTGNLNLTTKKENEATTIIVNFSQPTVGKDKTTVFTISYDSSELIKKSGQIWEVMVPRVDNIDKLVNYDLTLSIPLDFGRLAYISPKTNNIQNLNDTQSFIFNKQQLMGSGVVAAFGDFQLFDFNLSYHLNNPLNEEVLTKIAIPPDTELQKITYQLITPSPINIESDKDGNWLATYRLSPKEKKDVTVTGQAKIFSSPITINKSSEDKSIYLTSQKFWESDNPKIIELARNLQSPEKIYKYVVENLKYDYSRVQEGAERLGAIKAMENPSQAMCMEFSDLFVALCRAVGIPARVLDGYSYTDNTTLKPLSLQQDILHAWPEYWDSATNNWIQVDPTWQNTTGGIDYFHKLDLGHFVFAIHGIDSQYPIPAGGYKQIGTMEKDVNITFSQEENKVSNNIDTIINIPKTIYKEKTTKGIITIKNLGNEAIYNTVINFLTKNTNIDVKSEDIITQVPPYGSVDIPIILSVNRNYFIGSDKLTVSVNGKKYERQIEILSLSVNIALPIVVSIISLTIIIKIIGKIRNRTKSKQKVV